MFARCRRVALCLFACLAVAPHARATEVCADTPAEILAALGQWNAPSVNGVLRIKIVQGTYNLGNSLADLYYTGYELPRANDLEILGGYTSGCAARNVNPANTVLDGQNMANGGTILDGDTAMLRVEGVTWRHFSDGDHVLRLMTDGVASVRHCRFVQNSAGRQIVDFHGREFRLVNNLIAANTLAPAGFVVGITFNASDPAVIVTNNTVADNSGGAAGIKLDSNDHDSSLLSEVANNVTWANAGADIDLWDYSPSANPIVVYNNLMNDSAGYGMDATNLYANPQFVNAATLDYALAVTSPGVNSGSPIQLSGFPILDINGAPRVIGTHIDRGAYESSFDNRISAIVTTTADNGNNTLPTAGSLRAAIKAANASASPYTIRFAIPGTGPHLLTLQSPMLDIVGDVTIDGTTQPGTVENRTLGQFDATLQLIVSGAGTVPWAFRVPSSATQARLTLRGFMLAGFSDAAVKIVGGANHRIQGNQFGAIPFTSPNARAIQISGAAGGAFIGGYDAPEAVNLIAGSTNAGIELINAAGHSTVANNLIGFKPDGITGVANQVGISIFDSPGNTMQYNLIGFNTAHGIAVLGSSADNTVIQYNWIGTDPTGTVDAGNGGSGVLLSYGAEHNRVGASINGNYGGNFIVNNNPGVWVSPTAGVGNAILANQVFGSWGMNIDLDAAGPTPNQSTPPASGPNLLQNHPVLSQFSRNGSIAHVQGTLHAAASNSYRIDVYAQPACNGGGEAVQAVTHFAISTDGSGDATINADIASPLYDHLTATATDLSGNTSELGPCITVQAGPDALFANGFE